MEEQTTQTAEPVVENTVKETDTSTVLTSESDNQQQETPTTETTTTSDWKSSLPEELKNDPTLKNFKDVESLAKTVVHQQKQMGNRIPIPKTPEEQMEVYDKLGRPKTSEEYDIIVPDTHTQSLDTNDINNFKEVAHKIGLNQNQVAQLMEFEVNRITQQTSRLQDNTTVERDAMVSQLKEDWGTDYDRKMRNIQKAKKVYGNPELIEILEKTGAGNMRSVIEHFELLGRDITEDMTQNTQNNNLATSPLDAKTEIENIMNDPDDPYHDARHRDHRGRVEHMRQLHEKVHPS
tara:strand:- start:4066 stop:4941 length:876 start_codon:yes stop_codon:yes gene_type:complete